MKISSITFNVIFFIVFIFCLIMASINVVLARTVWYLYGISLVIYGFFLYKKDKVRIK